MDVILRGILRYVAILVAAVIVFSAATYLDRAPRGPKNVGDLSRPQMTQAPAEETAETADQIPWWEETQPAQTTESVEESPVQSYRLTFVGDCTLGCRANRIYAETGYTHVIGEDYTYPFRNVAEYFSGDDFTLINMEGVLFDNGYTVNDSVYYYGPTSYVNILTESSVEAVSLANDHGRDYGERGYKSTVSTLESAGIPYADREKSLIVTTESGLTIGIYGGVYFYVDEDRMVKEISALREQADLVIFVPHWGEVNSYQPNAHQKRLAYAAVDAGADIVYGNHPGVLQNVEEYNGSIIYSSLGTFSHGGAVYPSDYDTALIQQEVIRDADGTVRLGEMLVVPASMSSTEGRNDYQPRPYETGSEEYLRVMGKLGLA